MKNSYDKLNNTKDFATNNSGEFFHNLSRKEPKIKNSTQAKRVKKVYKKEKADKPHFSFSGIFKSKAKLLTEEDEKLVSEEAEKADKDISSTETLTEAEVEVKKQTTGKNKTLSIIFFIFNLCVVAGILIWQFKSSESKPLSELIDSKANFNWLMVAFLLFVILMIFESIRLVILIKNSTDKRRPFLSYKTSALGKYYDAITPLSTGGQPFQIMYLKKYGLTSGTASSVPIARFMFSQAAFVILAIIFLIVNVNISRFNGTVGESIVNIAGYAGIFISIVTVLGLLLLSTGKKIGPKIAIVILKILYKVKIIKNYSVAFKKVMHSMREYQSAVRKYISNIKVAFSTFLISALLWLISASIPFFIYLAFSTLAEPTIAMWLTITAKFFVFELATGFVPLPGAAGAAELSFAALFSTLFSAGSIFWAILIWRFLTYYIYILQGIIIIIYDMIKRNIVKSKKTENKINI